MKGSGKEAEEEEKKWWHKTGSGRRIEGQNEGN